MIINASIICHALSNNVLNYEIFWYQCTVSRLRTLYENRMSKIANLSFKVKKKKNPMQVAGIKKQKTLIPILKLDNAIACRL